MAIENFAVGTLIIPMDATYQNNGMFRAYGLVYNLLSNGIPVKWAIQSGKAFNGTDFTASATDFQTATPIVNHNYTGGPFIIDSAFAAAAAPFITAWQVANPNVAVHVASAPFSADIAATMSRPPRIAVEEANSGIVTDYLKAAGIPDSLGNIWSNASPDILDETDVAAGALFGYDLTACRRIAYDIFISPHTGTGVWDDPLLKVELNDYLYLGGMLHSMCESIPSIENTAGPFLTVAGIDDSDKNDGDTGTFTVDIPDFPTAQAVNTTNPQGTPGGSIETWLNANQSYNSQTQVIAHFTENGDQYDFMIAGPYKNGVGAGKVVYEGGHSYSTSLPYTGNDENMYTRFVLNDVFFAVGKPLMYLEVSPTTIFQGVINTITFSVVNTGASPSTGTGFSVTLTSGMTYNNDATISPTSIVGQTLTWSPAALGNVAPGTVLTFTADYQPVGLGPTQLATFSTSFGDEFNEDYSLNDVCVKANVEQFETADLNVVKTVDKAYAETGNILTYTVTITNNGTLTATNVVFTDPLPAGAMFNDNVTLTIPPGLPVPLPGADPSVGIPLPDIPPVPAPGSTVIITWQVIVDDNTPIIDIVNQAFVDYSFTNLQGTFDATAQSNIVTTQVELGELIAEKSADKTVATVSDTITYTVVVTNTGTVTADNVFFRDTPPNGTSFVPNSVTVDGNPVPGDPGILPGIPLPSIPPGGSVTVIFQVHVDFIPPPPPDPPIATNRAFIDFTYRVDPQGPEIPGLGISNPVITQLVSPGLSVVKSSDVAFANIGDTIIYTVTVTNTGDVTAEDVVLTDPVPTGTTFVPGSVTIDGSPAPGADPNVGIPLGDIPPGGSVTVIFHVTATSVPVPNPTTNIATASGLFIVDPGEPPRQLDFDSNPVDVQIENAFITATKGVDLVFAEVGDTLSYTVVIDNPGTTAANNVVFTDNPPNGTTFVPGSVTVNGAPVPGDPSLGIPVGTILAGGSATVTFEVTVDAIPVPNPAVNIGTVDADLPVDPNNPTHVTVDTNPVSTQVSIAQVDVIKSVDKAFAEVGDILTYTVTMNNVGTIPANNAVLTDIVPNGTTFVPGSVKINGAPSGADPNIGIPLGNIPAGGSVTVIFQVEATSIPVPNPAVNIATLSAEYPIDPNNPVQRDTDSNSVTTQMEIAQVDVVKIVDKAFAEVGETLTYTATITNTGTVPATSVVFTDVPPNGTSFIPGTLTVNGFPTAGNPALGINLPDIPVAGVVTVTFQVSVDAIPVPNPAVNISVVDALYPVDPNNPTPKTIESNPVTTQISIAELDVVKIVDRAFAEVCQNLTYTITVTNTGTIAANNVVVTDPPPNGTSFVGGTVIVNGVPDAAANPSLGINVGTIPAGGVATITFVVHADFVPVPNPTSNIAIISGSFPVDPNNPVDKEFESNPADTTIQIARLDMVKTADKAIVEVGDTVTYTVSINNTGTVPANNVVFTDTPPQGTSFVPGSATINGVPAPGADPAAGINLGTILVGGIVTITFQVTVDEIPVPNPTINIAAAEGSFPVNPENPTVKDFESNPVPVQVEQAELEVVKSVDKPFVEVGETVTYTVEITNIGTITATNVVFTDTPPVGTVFVPGSVTVNGAPVPGDPAAGISLPDISAGGMIIVTFQATVVSVPTPNPSVNTAIVDASFAITPGQPPVEKTFPSNPVDQNIILSQLDVVKSVDKAGAVVGDTLTYTVVVTNTGNVNADDTVVFDLVPAGTVFVPNSLEIDGVSKPGVNPNNGVQLGTLIPGESRTITFNVTIVSRPEPPVAINSATAEFEYIVNPAQPPRSKTEESNEVTTLIEIVELTLEKTAEPDRVVLGDIITYTTVVTNTGTVPVNNVIFKDEIPAGTSYVEGSFTRGGVIIPGANPEEGVNLGTINPGQSVTVTFQVRYDYRPCPPIIRNISTAEFNYMIISSGPVETGEAESNEVDTEAAQTNFKQLSVDENLTIPPQKPDAEDILNTIVDVVIGETRVIKTMQGISEEGQVLTGYKLIIEGILHQKVEYVADESSQTVHTAEFNVPFSSFIILHENFVEGSVTNVAAYVEDVYVKLLDKRNIFKNVTLRLEADIIC